MLDGDLMKPTRFSPTFGSCWQIWHAASGHWTCQADETISMGTGLGESSAHGQNLSKDHISFNALFFSPASGHRKGCGSAGAEVQRFCPRDSFPTPSPVKLQIKLASLRQTLRIPINVYLFCYRYERSTRMSVLCKVWIHWTHSFQKQNGCLSNGFNLNLNINTDHKMHMVERCTLESKFQLIAIQSSCHSWDYLCFHMFHLSFTGPCS